VRTLPELRDRAVLSPARRAAFIEKLLNLDETLKYRIVTCGEEMHRARRSHAYLRAR
jgi:hypothetical protein